MPRIAFSLRARLLALVLLAVLPALGLTLYTAAEQRGLAVARVQTESLRLTRLASAHHERLIEGTRQLLVALGQLPQVRSGEPAACSALFGELLTKYPLYANLGASGPDGDLFCSALSFTRPVSTAHRTWFRRAVESRDFAVGDYQIGAVTRRATVNFGYPVLGDAGRVQAVVFAALDLAWLNHYATRAELPVGAVLMVIDRNGTILVRHPGFEQWVGRSAADAPIVRTILAQQGEGTAEAAGADGVPRLYAFTGLGGGPGGGEAYVSVGIPRAVAFADADRALARNLAVLAIVAVLAFAGARLGAELFILRPVNALVATTRRLSDGDLRARTGLSYGQGELGQLARAFDDMAESLEQAQGQRLQQEELRRKNYELEQQNRSIQEANRLKTEFVSMVSHELRTPLTSIAGYVDLLLDGEADDPEGERRAFLTIIRNNADRLQTLINDLLDVSRIEAGRLELHRTTLDLARLIRHVASSLHLLIEAKGHHLTLDLADPLPTVCGDADRVMQILTNLLSNAVKYTPAGGSIIVAARGENGVLRVDVRDTGIGLSPDEQAQLFTKFFRARNPVTREVSGTGLGLTISRSLVELHGGEMTVASAPGQGSTFSFTLPAMRATQEVAPPERAPGPAQRAGRILVVDDEPDIANLIRRYLERAGHDVVLAPTAAEALRAARAQPLDLITLDVILPDTDGITVLEWLKSNPATAGIPVLLFSIVPKPEGNELLGAVDYLTKPVSERTLVERVERILAGERPRLVLVADDDVDTREFLAGRLRQAGYLVIEAADGAEAVTVARRDRPDLALIDVKMPGTDGISALRLLRAEATTHGLPVIMMTASPGMVEESRSVVEALGGATLLRKPCTAEELALAIARGLASLTSGSSSSSRPGSCS